MRESPPAARVQNGSEWMIRPKVVAGGRAPKLGRPGRAPYELVVRERAPLDPNRHLTERCTGTNRS